MTSTLKERISDWDGAKRRLAGLVAGAVLGCYAPLIPLNVVGIWLRNWLFMANNLAVMATLILFALMAEKARKPFLVYGIVIGLIVGFMAAMMVLTVPAANWVHYWVLPYYLAASVFVCHKTYRYFVS